MIGDTGECYIFGARGSFEFCEGSDGAVGIEALGVDTPVGIMDAVDRIVFPHPGNNETAVQQCRHIRIRLITGGMGIDLELAITVRRAIGVKALTVDTVA